MAPGGFHALERGFRSEGKLPTGWVTCPFFQVRDQDVPVKRNFARVVVSVSDANDHAPWFTSSSYEGRVFESAAPGSVVLQVTALDKDKGRNAEVVYSIESGILGALPGFLTLYSLKSVFLLCSN